MWLRNALVESLAFVYSESGRVASDAARAEDRIMTPQLVVSEIGSALWRLECGESDVAEVCQSVLTFVQGVLRDVTTERDAMDRIEQMHAMAREAAEIHDVSVSDIRGRGRTATISEARQAFSVDARDAGISLQQIGAYLGRDHSTVHYLIRRGRGEV